LEEVSERAIAVCEHQVAECTARIDKMEVTQVEREQFDRSNGWRAGHISDLERHLEAYWAEVVVAAARAGNPYAYGPDRLRQARRHLLSVASSVDTTKPAPAAARAREVASWLQETAPGRGPGCADLNDVEAAIIRARKVHAANAARRAGLQANPGRNSAPTGAHEQAVIHRGMQRDL
jgi:hypothetical protein